MAEPLPSSVSQHTESTAAPSRVFSSPAPHIPQLATPSLPPNPSPRPRSHELPAYHIRASSLSSRASQQVELSPAYLLVWDAQACRRVFLNSVDELRTEIAAGKANGVERLFVLHGLPADYLKVLRNSLEIDPAFIEAHAGRRRYRPLRWRRDAEFVHYEYPELLRGFKPEEDQLAEKRESRVLSMIDVMDDPPLHPMSQEGQAAMFCHASLWKTSQADILFLDRPLWREPTSQLRKSRRPVSVTKPYQLRPGTPHQVANSWDVQLADGDEIPSLDDELYDMLKDAAEVGDNLVDILSQLAHNHWLDFFEALPVSHSGARHPAGLLWQMAQSLEQNLDVSRYLSRGGRALFSLKDSDWEALVFRAQRRVDLCFLSAPKVSLSAGRDSTLTRSLTPRSPVDDVAAVAADTTAAIKENREDNKRSLDRVTYLGGILLPFTVVSGIFSIDGDYGPDGHKFYVFWVAASVSAAICLLIIYLDQVRGIEVWFEVAAGDAVEAILQPVSPLLNRQLERRGRVVTAPVVQARTESDGTIRLCGLGISEKPQVYTNEKGEVVIEMAPPPEGEVQVITDSPGHPTILVQRGSSGSQPKAWRRGPLGWAGAVKKIVGYYRLRGSNVKFTQPVMEEGRVRTV